VSVGRCRYQIISPCVITTLPYLCDFVGNGLNHVRPSVVVEGIKFDVVRYLLCAPGDSHASYHVQFLESECVNRIEEKRVCFLDSRLQMEFAF
jgi:hypothetical protein